LRQSMRTAGYDYGVTTVLGSANRLSDRYFLPRLPANEYDDDELFRAKLEGSYDWLHVPQLIYKFGRSWLQSSRRALLQERNKKTIQRQNP
jgi:hypothetical protein